ncbi:hypothetical protein D3C73_608370 [compost metagenome]
MGARVLNHFAQLVDDRLRCRKVGIAHAEIDNVRATRSRAGLQTVDLFENVRRQSADFMKLFHLSSHWRTKQQLSDINVSHPIALRPNRTKGKC